MTHDREPDRTWPARQHDWQRKLRRLRLSAEPVEEQLARYKRVTWMLTAVPLGLSLMFLALFSAFRRPDIGAILAGVLFLPVIAIAWLDYVLLAAKVNRYRRERAQYEGEQASEGTGV
ncbi:MAG: hypothetical protein P4L84_20115 [Isosphaeraceae bacterium]|nr:hypothetical protein [Isosphaeraceae bacterium]